MTVSEKHISAAIGLVDSRLFKALMAVGRIGKCAEMVTEALAAAEREGMRHAATFAAIHSQYPIENDYERGYAQGAKDAAARIRREANTHSEALPPPGATEAGEAVPQATSEASPATHHASRNGEGA